MNSRSQDLDEAASPPRDQAAQRLARGTARMLRQYGDVSLAEFTLSSGRRVDVIGIDAKGRVTIVEIKSGLEDYRTDTKWESYLDFCDFFYFAVATDFPMEILPQEVGLIAADAYGAEILRPSPAFQLNGARRRKLLLQFAQVAARRLHSLTDASE